MNPYGIQIFPTIVNDIIHIQINSNILVNNILLLDISGRVVFQVNAVSNDCRELNLSKLTSGLYFLKLSGIGYGKRFDHVNYKILKM